MAGNGRLSLVKMAAGIGDLDTLTAHQARMRRINGTRLGRDVLVVDTRNTPRHCDELRQGGSIYWVTGGAIRARNAILSIEAITRQDGRMSCRIELAPELVRVREVPRKPFSGWRYLEDAPEDAACLAEGIDPSDMPDAVREELRRIGAL